MKNPVKDNRYQISKQGTIIPDDRHIRGGYAKFWNRFLISTHREYNASHPAHQSGSFGFRFVRTKKNEKSSK